jgi:hypothetical protein
MPFPMRRLFPLVFALLVLVRVPSLVQPAGADQGLYAYVGQRILDGGLPYRDAWDQKPPAVHFVYAAMYALWPDQSVVPATDLAVAVLSALLLLRLGRQMLPASGAGEAGALLFLFFGNPAFARLGGVRVRAQCEVFIALLVTSAFLVLWRATRGRDPGAGPSSPLIAVAGLGLGTAATFKYNAAAYVFAAAIAAALWPSANAAWAGTGGNRVRLVGPLLAGFLVPVAAMAALFAAGGALDDLFDATIGYNLRYSGETYGGPLSVLQYLVTFPVRHARVDTLWWMGGLGCVALLVAARRRLELVVLPLWVAAACASIAINGSRGLPQYFVQAGPALALSAGAMLAIWWGRSSALVRAVMLTALAVGAWRVTDMPKGVDYTWHDLRYLGGRLSRAAYLERFGARASDDKYSALAIEELSAYLREHSDEDEPVLVFGFSQGALVEAPRVSASRFFWSRPVIVGFNEGRPGYGVAGLLDDLRRTPPRIVALQRTDWPDSIDSARFFLGTPALAGWLNAHYEPAGELGSFLLWQRRS